MTLASFVLACSGATPLAARRDAVRAARVLYFHQGPAAGPVLFTGADGALVEERRFEPFGQPLDSAGQGGVVTGVDLALDPTSALNKETDPASGLSYHGARWLDPRTAHWLSTDPPTRAPDPGYMAHPWQLNPYQYVAQDPVSFWDPDGRREKLVCDGSDDDAPASHPVAYTPASAPVSQSSSTSSSSSGSRGPGPWAVPDLGPAPAASTPATPPPAPTPTITPQEKRLDLSKRLDERHANTPEPYENHVLESISAFFPPVGTVLAAIRCDYYTRAPFYFGNKWDPSACLDIVVSAGPKTLGWGLFAEAHDAKDQAVDLINTAHEAFTPGEGGSGLGGMDRATPDDANFSPDDPMQLPYRGDLPNASR
jgi:RHS repeat-associated protein